MEWTASTYSSWCEHGRYSISCDGETWRAIYCPRGARNGGDVVEVARDTTLALAQAACVEHDAKKAAGAMPMCTGRGGDALV